MWLSTRAKPLGSDSVTPKEECEDSFKKIFGEDRDVLKNPGRTKIVYKPDGTKLILDNQK